MPTGSEITVNVTNPASVSVDVPGASTTVPTIVNGGTANVNVTSVGDRGPKGDLGPAVNLTIGTVTKGINAAASITGTPPNQTLNLTLPQGDTGPAGGFTTISVGNTTTLTSGSNATVTATSSNNGANLTLDFGIPEGQVGSQPGLSGGTPANLGTASAGISNLASRADHVHALPVISYANLSGVPANFPTNTTLVSGLAAGYSASNHGHNYVTSLNGLAGAINIAAGPNVTLSASNLTLTIDSTSAGIGQNDAVDGGFYVGEIVGGITFSVQPQSQTVSVGAFSVSNVTLPDGSYLGFSYANGSYFATPSNADMGGDYLAKSTNGISWTRQNAAFSSAAAYKPVQFGGGLYLTVQGTTGSGQKYATSNDGVTWTERTPPFVFRDVKHIAGLGWVGHYVANTYSRFQVSTDGVTWANLYNGNAFQTENVWFALIAGKFVVNGSAAAISGGSIGSFSGPEIDGGFVAAGPASAVYANGLAQTLTIVDWSAGAVTLYDINFFEPYSAAYHSPSGRWLIVNSSGVWTTSGTSAPALRLNQSLAGATASRVFVSSGGRAVFVKAEGGSAFYWLFTSDDGGLTWTQRQSSVPSSVNAISSAAGDLVYIYGAGFINNQNPLIAVNPGGTTATASFTTAASASSGNPVSYQWQNSLDAGASWANVANATSGTLALTGLTTSDNGTRFRAVASATGAASVNSQTATLTVTG